MLCNLYVFPKYLNDLRSVNGLSRVMYCVIVFSTCFDMLSICYLYVSDEREGPTIHAT